MIFRQYRKNIIWFTAVVLIFIGIVFVYRGVVMQRNKLPVAVTYKIRNASAHESEWRIATTAQAGDVIDHFLLIRLADKVPAAVAKVTITPQADSRFMYREATLASAALGITAGSAEAGLNIPLIKPGEFADIKWQTRLKDEVAFSGSEAPLLENRVSVSASGYSGREGKALVTLSSTVARSDADQAEPKLYFPRLVSMNPRQAYDDLGTGVLIAGEDLTGLKTLRISGFNRTLITRLISDDLLEAGIPAGLKEGSYTIEAIDRKGAVLADKLSFTIRPANARAVVVKVTPSIVKSGKHSTIVLQGVHLGGIATIRGQNGQSFNLENVKKINDRVVTADVPADLKRGEYKLVIEDNKQEPVLVVD